MALFERGVVEIVWRAHVLRNFAELREANKIASTALERIDQFFEVERCIRDLDVNARLRLRNEHTDKELQPRGYNVRIGV